MSIVLAIQLWHQDNTHPIKFRHKLQRCQCVKMNKFYWTQCWPNLSGQFILRRLLFQGTSAGPIVKLAQVVYFPSAVSSPHRRSLPNDLVPIFFINLSIYVKRCTLIKHDWSIHNCLSPEYQVAASKAPPFIGNLILLYFGESVLLFSLREECFRVGVSIICWLENYNSGVLISLKTLWYINYTVPGVSDTYLYLLSQNY